APRATRRQYLGELHHPGTRALHLRLHHPPSPGPNRCPGGIAELSVDLLDGVILIAIILYAIGGYRNGAVVGLFSLAGFLGGAVIGAQLGRPLGSRLASGQGQVIVAILCLLVVSLLGQFLFVYLARLLRMRITWKAAQAVDAGIGAL